MLRRGTVDRLAPLPVCPSMTQVPLHGDSPLAAFAQGTLSPSRYGCGLYGPLKKGAGRFRQTKSPGFQGFLGVSEATVGLEPTLRVLQTLALPLGDVAGCAQGQR